MSKQEQEDVRSGSTRVGSNLRIVRRYYSIYSNIRVLEFAERTRTYLRKYSNPNLHLEIAKNVCPLADDINTKDKQ